jgi:hypothetical protein
MLSWLRAQPCQPATLDQLQVLLDLFARLYNQQRPHRSLPHRATPAAVYQSMPKAAPATSRELDHHHRVRHDVIDNQGKVTLRHQGRLFHIGVGRTHARTPVLMLVQDLDVRVVHAATGELLRALTLAPRGRTSPPAADPGHHLATTPELWVQGVSYVLRDDSVLMDGNRTHLGRLSTAPRTVLKMGPGRPGESRRGCRGPFGEMGRRPGGSGPVRALLGRLAHAMALVWGTSSMKASGAGPLAGGLIGGPVGYPPRWKASGKNVSWRRVGGV